MAVDAIHFAILREAKITGSCLSAGYPDLLLTKAEIGLPDEFLKVRTDSAAVAKHHACAEPIYDSYQVFQGLGLTMWALDRERRHGWEFEFDLNQPQTPYNNLGSHDLVIDPGTTEHCFNIAQAAQTLLGAVKLGRYISQAVPMAMFNHGYYNLNPVWFHDCYEKNGFEMRKIVIRNHDKVFENPTRQRLTAVPDGAVIITLAQRTCIRPFEYPQQKLPG